MSEEQIDLLFNFAHIGGQGKICFLPNGDVASCGVDGLIKIWKIQDGNISTEEEIDDDHNHAIVFLLATSSGKLISGSADCNIVEHEFDEESNQWKISRVLAKTTSVPKCAIYIPEKNIIVLGLEEGKMITIGLEDSSVIPFMPVHPAEVLTITCNPKKSMIASYCADGCVRIWDIDTKKVLSTEKILSSFSKSVHGDSLGIDWSTNERLAVTSGTQGEVSIYSINSNNHLKSEFSFQNNDQTIVSNIKFSPDSAYICCSSSDGEIILYDYHLQEIVKEYGHECGMSDIIWGVNGKELRLVFLDSQGQLALWEKCALLSKEEPEKPVIQVNKPIQDTGNSECDEDDVSVPQQRKRLVKKASTTILSSDDEGVFDDIGMELDEDEEDNHVGETYNDYYDSYHTRQRNTTIPMQESFQIGSAPPHKEKHLLNWNLLGTVISTTEENGKCMIDIKLNDCSKSQPKRMIDHYKFTRAALGESGVIFSSEVDEKVPATIYYRPFVSWTSNSEWRKQLDYSEQVLGLAIGSKFVAIATDQMTIRILTTGGVQYGLFSIPGPYVCSSGYQDKLAVVYHRTAPFAGNQSLGLLIYDFSLNVITLQQDISLSPRSHIHWLGWDEDGSIICVDDIGTVRALVMSSQPQLSQGRLNTVGQNFGMWIPLTTLNNDEDLFHWIVGCTKEQIIYLECKAGDKHPVLIQSYTPSVNAVTYTAPLLPQTTESENELFIARSQIQNIPDASLQITRRQQLDKSLLRLFHSSCNEDKLQKALDFANLLMFPKAMDIAIQVANSANITSLVNHLVELKSEIQINATPPVVNTTEVIRQESSYTHTPLQEEEEINRVDEMNISKEEEIYEKENHPESSPKNLSEKLKPSISSTKSKTKMQTKKVINPFSKVSNKESKKGSFFLNDIVQEEKSLVGNKRKFKAPNPAAKRTKF